MKLSGWGRFRPAECRVIKPRSKEDLINAIRAEPSLIARGNGRSYGDAAINADATILMTQLNRFIAFDSETGIVNLESGVLLSELLDIVVPKGWFPLVTPGTKFVTIGGMMASDVHGKNHHRDGSFRQSVIEFSLIDGDGEVHVCSREANSELFDATLGGMGLTGIILDAKLRLIPIESAYIIQTTDRCDDLDHVFQTLEQRKGEQYTVAWIDCSARGKSLGRGLVFSGHHALRHELSPSLSTAPYQIEAGRKRAIQFTIPIDVLRRPVLVAFNSIYYMQNKIGKRPINYDSYFYPLDAISEWNRVYGPNGFVQFQCVIPEDRGQNVIRKMIEMIAQSGAGSPLAVLKYLGPGADYLSFPCAGLTLALDFPAREATLKLQNRLNELVADEGGRLYFAKDATASSSTALKGYSSAAFLDARKRISKAERFNSSLSRRIGLTA